MSFGDSAGTEGASSGEPAGLFFPCLWEEDFQDKAWAGREETEGGGEKSSASCAKCRQPAEISASSSREWNFVLALAMISMCEELQCSSQSGLERL